VLEKSPKFEDDDEDDYESYTALLKTRSNGKERVVPREAEL